MYKMTISFIPLLFLVTDNFLAILPMIWPKWRLQSASKPTYLSPQMAMWVTVLKKWRKSGNAIFTLVLTVAVEVHGDHGDVVTEVTEGLTSTGAPWKHCFTQQQLTAPLVKDLPQGPSSLPRSTTQRWCDGLLSFFLCTASPSCINCPNQSTTCP